MSGTGATIIPASAKKTTVTPIGRASPLQWEDLSSADLKTAKELYDVIVNVCEDKTAVAYRKLQEDGFENVMDLAYAEEEQI